MWIHHSLAFIVICTIVLGEEAAREAESLVTAALESEKFRDTSKNVTKEIDTTERGRRKSKEETRQEISDAIAQSSRLLVALKTEVDMNIKTKDLANHSSFVMFLRKGLSKILGFKISLLKFLAMGTDKVDEQKLSNSINASSSFAIPPQKANKSNDGSSKITKVYQILSEPILKPPTTVKPAAKNNNRKGDILKNWLKPQNRTSSDCDVVILVKKCELKPGKECVEMESCHDNQKICKPTPCQKIVARNVCRYVPVNKNCHP